MKITIYPPLPQTFVIPDGMRCGGCKYLKGSDCTLFGGAPFGKVRKFKVAECYNETLKVKKSQSIKGEGKTITVKTDYMDFIHD